MLNFEEPFDPHKTLVEGNFHLLGTEDCQSLIRAFVIVLLQHKIPLVWPSVAFNCSIGSI